MSTGQQYTVATARRAAEQGTLDAWVAEFLASPGSDNRQLAELLSDPSRTWIGPVRLPLDQLHRLAGPAEHPVLCPVDEDYWRDDVEDLAAKVDDGWEPPPMVATFRDDHLVLEDGNHRAEGLRRSGEREAWAVVSFDDAAQRDRFLARAGALDDGRR